MIFCGTVLGPQIETSGAVKMSRVIPILAAADPHSSAYKVGEVSGDVLLAALALYVLWRVLRSRFSAPDVRTATIRLRFFAGASVVVLIGVATVASLKISKSDPMTNESSICRQASAGASHAFTIGTAAITPGGTPLTGVPAVPIGQIADCSVTLTSGAKTITGYLAEYKDAADLAGYDALLLRHGFTRLKGLVAESSETALAGPGDHTVVVITTEGGQSAAIELSLPGGVDG